MAPAHTRQVSPRWLREELRLKTRRCFQPQSSDHQYLKLFARIFAQNIKIFLIFSTSRIFAKLRHLILKYYTSRLRCSICYWIGKDFLDMLANFLFRSTWLFVWYHWLKRFLPIPYTDAILRLYYIYTWISVKENVVKL